MFNVSDRELPFHASRAISAELLVILVFVTEYILRR